MGSSAPLALLPLLSTLAGAGEEEDEALNALPPPSADESPRLLARVLMARLADATRGVWPEGVRFRFSLMPDRWTASASG